MYLEFCSISISIIINTKDLKCDTSDINMQRSIVLTRWRFSDFVVQLFFAKRNTQSNMIISNDLERMGGTSLCKWSDIKQTWDNPTS